MLSKEAVIGVVGAGAMGSGIAQVAAMAGHKVIIYELRKVKHFLRHKPNGIKRLAKCAHTPYRHC